MTNHCLVLIILWDSDQWNDYKTLPNNVNHTDNSTNIAEQGSKFLNEHSMIGNTVASYYRMEK